LFLKNFPLTAVDRVAISYLDVIKVKNTNTVSTASVSVTSTGLRLVKDGVADTSVTFAANATLTAIVSAINGVSGWSAELFNSSYGNYKSSELIEFYGLSAINNNWVYLRVPDEAEDYIKVDINNGSIFKRPCWPKGVNNIYVDYTAGFTSSNMPKDLQLAIKIITKFLYDKKDEETFGVSQWQAENLTGVFEEKGVPMQALLILNSYRNKKV